MQLPIIKHDTPKYNIKIVIDNQINSKRQFICYLSPYNSHYAFWFTPDKHLFEISVEHIYKSIVDEWNISTIINKHTPITTDNPIERYHITHWQINQLPSYKPTIYPPNFSVTLNTFIQQ